MNPQIEKLYLVAKKDSRIVIGLMSGTSLDGLDIALCEFKNAGPKVKVQVKAFTTIGYSQSFKSSIREVFAKDTISLPHLCRLNALIGTTHGKMISEALSSWRIKSSEIDAIASHGQTVMHSPKRLHQIQDIPNATLQIGDGDHLAKECGILTISDFRQKHVATGGEGAPLALYGDYLLFSSEKENRVLVNIGGIANYTYLPMSQDFQSVYATDTGPGNTIIDAFVQKYFQVDFDKDALIAKQGSLNQELLTNLLEHPYFGEAIPKTTGPELFNLSYLQKALGSMEISKVDTLHTLCHFTAATLAHEIKKNTSANDMANTAIYLSGGGMHNPLICQLLATELSSNKIAPMDALGVSGDAKEAVLFAALANETLAGKTGFESHFINKEPFYMGKVSFPM